MSYQVFFNLDDSPFRLPPDPEYYFPSKRHNEALETLLYSVESGEGFVQLTGDPGVGKTLLIRSFLNQLGKNVNTALILHPRLTAEELFKVILEDLGLAPDNIQEMSKETLLRSFRDILLKSANDGMRTLVIIDEAQELPENTLEELRLLSNLETEKAKLLQIILVGQRELEETLQKDSLKQLHQRITIRYRLSPLSLDEATNYIQHRLKIAGGGNITRFNSDILEKIHTYSKGIPRIINVLCERCLMAAFIDGKSNINEDHLQNALQSLDYNENVSTGDKKNRTQAFIIYIAVMLGCIALYFSNTPLRNQINLKTLQLLSFLQTEEPSVVIPSSQQNIAKITVQEQQQTTEPAVVITEDVPLLPLPVTVPQQKATLSEKKEDKLRTTNGQKIAEVLQKPKSTSVIPVKPTPPLPPGWKGVSINRSNGNVKLFFGSHNSPEKTLRLPIEIRLENGIYLLGQEDGKPFLFNHRSFFSWQMDQSLADWLWSQFKDVQFPAVIPVIVSSISTDQFSTQEERKSIETMVNKWATAYDNKDIQELMQYYDDSLVTYNLFHSRPIVVGHTEVTASKDALFETAKALSLQISKPVCIVNNNDTSQAIAVFHQQFISSSYHDTGIKVLYLRRTGAKTADRPQWVITGRLWLGAEPTTQ